MNTAVRKTIAQSGYLEGKGLHTGQAVRLDLSPAKSGDGIRFTRKDLPGSAELSLLDVFHDGPPMRSSLKRGAAEVHTVEHLLAALHGLGITDLHVALDGPEMPGLDGSAEPIASKLKACGVSILEGTSISILEVTRVHTISEGAAQLVAMPHPEGLRLTYTLNYPSEPLAQGFLSLSIDEEVFLKEISTSRTFCLHAEAEALLAAGFGKGAGTHNTLVLKDGVVLENSLRFPDEPVRHKILDLLGDLYLLGRPIRGHIIGHRSGHGLNRALAKALSENET